MVELTGKPETIDGLKPWFPVNKIRIAHGWEVCRAADAGRTVLSVGRET
jgi:hypothetical protein